MDAAGSSLRDVADQATSPFRQCMAQLQHLLQSAPLDAELAAIFRHWDQDEHTELLLTTARDVLSSLHVQIWFHCVLMYEDWPYTSAL